jgi:hypothetical protein
MNWQINPLYLTNKIHSALTKLKNMQFQLCETGQNMFIYVFRIIKKGNMFSVGQYTNLCCTKLFWKLKYLKLCKQITTEVIRQHRQAEEIGEKRMI